MIETTDQKNFGLFWIPNHHVITYKLLQNLPFFFESPFIYSKISKELLPQLLSAERLFQHQDRAPAIFQDRCWIEIFSFYLGNKEILDTTWLHASYGQPNISLKKICIISLEHR